MAEKKKEDLFNAIDELEKLGKKKGVVSMQAIQDRLSHFEVDSDFIDNFIEDLEGKDIRVTEDAADA